MQKLSKASICFFCIALLYTGAILYLSLINLADTSVSEMNVSDKILHGGAYFVLGILWMFFTLLNDHKGILKKLAIVSILLISFGTFIEVLQGTLTQYRQLDFWDILANSAGIGLAAILVWNTQDFLIRLKAKINLIFMKK